MSEQEEKKLLCKICTTAQEVDESTRVCKICKGLGRDKLGVKK